MANLIYLFPVVDTFVLGGPGEESNSDQQEFDDNGEPVESWFDEDGVPVNVEWPEDDGDQDDY